MMTRNNTARGTLGIYVHVPFCKRKCNYCDFCSTDTSCAHTRERYVYRLCEEIENNRHKAIGKIVDTVFFGGGTPSMLTCEHIGQILDKIRMYGLAEDAEVTIEVNPGTVNAIYLKKLKDMGINRLSIGMQSSSDETLEFLGRIHTRADFEECYSAARLAGFDNISVDLMTALPKQSMEELSADIDYVLSIGCEHISAYMLKIEDGTPFARMRLRPLPEDICADMYLECARRFSEAGYEHYEISNFARHGRESRHNLKYWLGDEYMGFGVAAHSYFDGARYSNDMNIDEYIEHGATLASHEEPDGEDRLFEYVMLRLRLRRGISLSEIAERFRPISLDALSTELKRLAVAELLHFDGDCVSLTDKGMCVSNEIICLITDIIC